MQAAIGYLRVRPHGLGLAQNAMHGSVALDGVFVSGEPEFVRAGAGYRRKPCRSHRVSNQRRPIAKLCRWRRVWQHSPWLRFSPFPFLWMLRGCPDLKIP